MGHVIDIGGGIRLACDDVGSGRPVLLVGWSMGNAATCILLDQSLRDVRPVVGSYELPTLCSWGRDEKLVPIAAGEWLAARQPADLHLFERSGHCPMWE